MNLRAVPAPRRLMIQASALIDRLFACLNAHDDDCVRSLLSSEFEFVEGAPPGAPSERALLDRLALLRRAFPDIVYRVARTREESGWHYVEFKALGTHSHEFLSVQATSALMVISGVFAVQQRHDLICRLRVTLDFRGLREQMLVAAAQR